MRVIVCGDRNWSGLEAQRVMVHQLTTLPRNTIIVEGGCRGADLMAAEIARRLGFVVEEHPAKWGEHGRAAGAELVLAFHNNFEHSKGTKDMVTIARKAGIATYIYSEQDSEKRGDRK